MRVRPQALAFGASDPEPVWTRAGRDGRAARPVATPRREPGSLRLLRRSLTTRRRSHAAASPARASPMDADLRRHTGRCAARDCGLRWNGPQERAAAAVRTGWRCGLLRARTSAGRRRSQRSGPDDVLRFGNAVVADAKHSPAAGRPASFAGRIAKYSGAWRLRFGNTLRTGRPTRFALQTLCQAAAFNRLNVSSPRMLREQRSAHAAKSRRCFSLRSPEAPRRGGRRRWSAHALRIA